MMAMGSPTQWVSKSWIKNTGDEPEFNLENPEDNFIPEEIWDDNDLLVATGYDGDVNFDVYWEMYG